LQPRLSMAKLILHLEPSLFLYWAYQLLNANGVIFSMKLAKMKMISMSRCPVAPCLLAPCCHCCPVANFSSVIMTLAIRIRFAYILCVAWIIETQTLISYWATLVRQVHELCDWLWILAEGLPTMRRLGRGEGWRGIASCNWHASWTHFGRLIWYPVVTWATNSSRTHMISGTHAFDLIN